ncbi:MAG: hypothetical protein H6767_02620 [Candidatus Peribacteria bacterium]|nr:MAG: hypothetical protein H6767_02620 [Candidatus Peribacteria bacterium]
MSGTIIKFILKVSILSGLIVFVLAFGSRLLPDTSIAETKTENQTTYKQRTDNGIVAHVGVAITTNLGTRFKQTHTLPATIYKDVMAIEEIIADQQTASNEIIGKNMAIIGEYLNVLKTDVLQLLDASYDRPATLDAYIAQLEFRYKQGVESANTLVTQRASLEQTMTDVNTKIENLKLKIGEDFSSSKDMETLQNIDEYLRLKQEYNYARTYAIFINKFIAQYNFLNEYNKVLLDTLINNRVAIIKSSFVVIPDSGEELLRKLNLLYEENDFKSIQN